MKGSSRLLHVFDDSGQIGTIDLVDNLLIGNPPELLALLQSRLNRGMTARQAFDDLAGWSNGWIWVRATEQLAEDPEA